MLIFIWSFGAFPFLTLSVKMNLQTPTWIFSIEPSVVEPQSIGSHCNLLSDCWHRCAVRKRENALAAMNLCDEFANRMSDMKEFHDGDR